MTAEWRTSATDPYEVDWIDLEAVPGLASAVDAGGALGMSFTPGKHDPYGMHDRDVAADVQALRDVHGVTSLLLLIEDHELDELQVAELPVALADAGIDLVRYPIPDFGVPEDPDAFGLIADDVMTRVRGGQRVVVACRGGFGRTGAVVGSMLRSAGLAPDDAVAMVRAVRPGTIELDSQAAFVETWSA